jgi:hypothetical protein
LNELNGDFKELHIHNSRAEDDAPAGGGSSRPKDIRNRTQFERKMAGEYAGHPNNYFVNIARLSWPTGYRATNAYQIEGGGVLIQNSWYEEAPADGPAAGRFAIDHYGVHIPDAVIEMREYTDDDGEHRVSPVIVKKPRAPWWRRIFGRRA